MSRGKKMIVFLKKIAHNSHEKSFVTKLRRKRFHIFQNLIERCYNKKKITVLDLGGTPAYWNQVYDINKNPLNLEITILNLHMPIDVNTKFKYLLGDARDLSHIPDQSFDVCFSNSMIEHLGDLCQQQRCIKEMKRVCRTLYLQTPNLYFPIEPHYQIPFIQFLPIHLRMKILSIFNRTTVITQYENYLNNPIQLLSKKDLKFFFAENEYEIILEKLFFMTKSFVVISRKLPATSAK